MQTKKILPPTYFQIAIILSVLLHFILPIYQWIDFPLSLLGFLPALFGITLNLVADKAFKKGQTTVKPFEKSTVLITNGVFTISRNPMYMGMVMIMLGITTVLGSVSPLIITVLFAVILHQVFIKSEEVMLEDAFGEAWLTYKKQARRWI